MRIRSHTLRKFLSIVRQTAAAWVEHHASSSGAALAFYTLFAIAPVTIIAVGLAATFIGESAAQSHILAQIRGLIGDQGAAAIGSLLANSPYRQKSGLEAALGILTLLVGATSVFGELQDALNRIWATPKQTGAEGWWLFLRTRILSFGLILVVGFLLLVSLIASAALAAFGNWLGTFLSQWKLVLGLLDVGLSFSMATLLFAMIYKYLPRETITWGDVWIGGAVTAALFTIGKTFIGFYLGRNALTSAYGAAGSFVVLLLWVYYSAQIFLLGAEFTCVFAYQTGSRYTGPRAR
jgi:membrane protein